MTKYIGEVAAGVTGHFFSEDCHPSKITEQKTHAQLLYGIFWPFYGCFWGFKLENYSLMLELMLHIAFKSLKKGHLKV